MNPNYENAASKAINLVKELIDKNGPRVCGSKGNYATVKDLELGLKEICSSTQRDRFDIHPNSLFSIGKYFSLSYVVGLIAVLVCSPFFSIIAIICMSFCIIFCLSQFILYSDLFDGFFKRVEGNNLVGFVEPEKEVKEQIILVGHHDSSPIYTFHEKFPILFSLRLFIPIILFLFEFVILILSLFGGNDLFVSVWLKYLSLIGLIFTLPMYWYISKKPSLGAGDNLIGCTIGIGIAEFFGSNRLKNTRLVLLLADGEEVGQKGSKHFINSNMEWLTTVGTKVIAIDSIYEKGDVLILRRDRNGLTKLSIRLVNSLKKISEQKGYNFRVHSIPMGGGGTDGGQFARKGIETVSIVGTQISPFRKEIIIHTTKDVPESIKPDAVRSVIEVVCEYIQSNDELLESPEK